MAATDLSLDRDGAQLLPGLAVPMLDQLAEVARRHPANRAGTRIVGDEIAAGMLSRSGHIAQAVAGLTKTDARPVRAILFDKSDQANWALGWHQDRTIAVARCRDTPGFGPWTVKQGIQHVEPPFALIERMTTVRIHLDPVDADNAPLLIALGSHLAGRIPAERVTEVVERCSLFACMAEPGDVWVYSTPILHASQAAAGARRRRVLQADYSPATLPSGLEWLTI